jgi:hypothetical protein
MGRMVSTERNESRQIQKPKMIVFSMAMGTFRKLAMRSDLSEAELDSATVGCSGCWISCLRCSQREKLVGTFRFTFCSSSCFVSIFNPLLVLVLLLFLVLSL